MLRDSHQSSSLRSSVIATIHYNRSNCVCTYRGRTRTWLYVLTSAATFPIVCASVYEPILNSRSPLRHIAEASSPFRASFFPRSSPGPPSSSIHQLCVLLISEPRTSLSIRPTGFYAPHSARDDLTNPFAYFISRLIALAFISTGTFLFELIPPLDGIAWLWQATSFVSAILR